MVYIIWKGSSIYKVFGGYDKAWHYYDTWKTSVDLSEPMAFVVQ